MPAAISLSESDLHGLVDGRLDAARRADALRALAASPADQARVDAWQEQNDLIRATFAGVDKEPLPLSMRLVAPPTLHDVPAPVCTLHAPPARSPQPRRVAAGLVIVTLACGGLVASWLTLAHVDDPPLMVDPGLRGPVDESLAAIASDALADDIGARKPARAEARPQALGAALPTTTIPDLSPAGFVFTRAENQGASPQALVFHYRNAAAEHVAVSVARSDSETSETALAPVGRSLIWHHGATAYAVAGTVRPDRLRSIAALVRTADIQE